MSWSELTLTVVSCWTYATAGSAASRLASFSDMLAAYPRSAEEYVCRIWPPCFPDSEPACDSVACVDRPPSLSTTM